ncbi:hypothetical protein [Catenuloplanes indicus]|uniref:Pyruvate/2-oxoglutarate dehydrogenase complex dihydrolipoamide acyltransferase (E2) component n=1 Tax=Catenuloplanes indicus TaxID=137267 RepID=A0AAE4AXA6_9ACTN|nr:hypothetical protein [Catenuloplanes indicus]MDQ0366810.1 pyruvate/2-oxoglutarate dehydrogenase complex dihydrolipoamide acyltransferase (E2) component [Catenuloplanes indicus]
MNRLRAGLTGIALVALLTACGAEPPAEGTAEADQVVSLSSATPGATAPAATAPAERPLLRPDTSDVEEERLYDVWFDCLEEKGGRGRGPKEVPDGDRGAPAPGPAAPAAPDPAAEAQDAAAQKACENLEPEAPWQRAKRLDPDYADKLRDWITCIRSHGIDAWESDGFVTFESLPPDDKMVLVGECEMKAFSVS